MIRVIAESGLAEPVGAVGGNRATGRALARALGRTAVIPMI
jgi:hypothetical protein